MDGYIFSYIIQHFTENYPSLSYLQLQLEVKYAQNITYRQGTLQSAGLPSIFMS